MSQSWYKIRCFPVPDVEGAWESDPMLEAFWQSPVYRLRGVGTKLTKDFMLAFSISPLPEWLLEYPDEIVALTHDEASVTSIAWFPTHEETYINPDGTSITAQVPARDVTKEYPDA